VSEALLAPERAAQTPGVEREPALAIIESQHGPMQVRPGEALLDTLERHGHQLEYQCRSGYCGACRTPLLAGKVHYPEPPLAFVEAGQCLPCCCRPVGDITLDLSHHD
jgi:ferredoxin